MQIAKIFGILTAAYITTSSLFFIFPTLIHKKKKFKLDILNQSIDNHKILQIAHRGGSRLNTQNTIQCFDQCLQKTTVDIIQMDVCLTKDKQLVVHHDTSLFRTCGINKKIQQLSFAELPKYQDSFYLDFAVNLKRKSNNQRIPLLEEVFKKYRNLPLNIQIKTPSMDAINEFNRLVKLYDRESITFWGIRGQLHKKLKQINPNILTFINDQQAFKIFFSFLIGFLPFINISGDSLQIPLYTSQYYEWKILTQKNVFKTKIFFFFLNLFNLSYGPIINHLKKRGIISMFWVCNTQQHYIDSINKGVTGIMTDDPILLKNFMNKKQK